MKLGPFSKYIGLSALVHVGIVALLSISMSMTPKPKIQPQPQGQPIQAVTIDQSRIDEQVKRIKADKERKRLAEKKRIEELERKLKEVENKRKAEQNRLKKLETERKRKEQEKKAADKAVAEAKKKQKLEAEKARKAEAERKRKEAERKAAEKAAAEAKKKREKEEAERRRKEEERKRKEQEAREQAELERLMQQELEAENQQIGQQRQAQILSEIDKFTALIRATIQRNWLVDSSMAGKQCQLTIRLARDGFVTSVDNGVGDPVVCSSARNAVLKAGTLPMSADPEVNQKMREIRLTVEPNL
ncbi:hypothetical protein GCM10011369_17810 [Neiella marina]|uniref:Cell envelope integrity protein TolA n=1 Tax=Neiella marina TaxID=508461 RepID=A0A8J2U4V4_9GAMM|nr:cell envelope integrity protein TolA [Neiella marina]GGA76377.1 hypothetical protein GCM10011369_17810 [Neiella marina]